MPLGSNLLATLPQNDGAIFAVEVHAIEIHFGNRVEGHEFGAGLSDGRRSEPAAARIV